MGKKMPFFKPKEKETFNLKKEIFRYVKNWKWFLFSALVFLLVAYYFINKRAVIYETHARVKIINQSVNEIELPGNLKALLDDSKLNLENEIEIIKSYRILEKVSENLNLNIRYYEVSKNKQTQVWKIPLSVAPLKNGSLPEDGEYIVEILQNGFTITDLEKNTWRIPNHHVESQFEDLPFLINFELFENTKNYINRKIKVRFFSIKEATLRLLSGLNIEQVGKNSEILRISLTNESSAKSEAVLNEIIKQFNQDGVQDRKLIFQRTIDFVDERFEYLTKELDSIENRKRQFKEKNNLTDIDLDTEQNLTNKSSSNVERTNLETQLEIARILRKTLTDTSQLKLLPADIGIGIGGINDQIILFNKKVLEYNDLIISAGSNNPLVKNVKKDIQNLRSNVLMSVVAYQKKMQTALDKIKVLDKKNKSFFRAIPNKEKILREIERDQSIKENLFIFLLQRREEAAINLVITAPTLKVVDFAITNLIPVSESPKLVFLKAFIAGLIVPFVIFYLVFFFDTRIVYKEDMNANISSNNLLGEIPFSSNHKLFSGLNDNSILAESFRILRTNISHKIKKKSNNKGAQLFMVTSPKGVEGKTFCAINLAISYAVLNKKVLLIEANFRNPNIIEYVSTSNKKEGLSDYLQGSIDTIQNAIVTCKIKETKLDVIYAGEIPKAPAELLFGDKLNKAILSVKDNYDYIILDTPSVANVTDTLLISEIPDLTLCIAKSNYTDRSAIKFSEELVSSQKLKNVNYVLNGVESNTFFNTQHNSKLSFKSKIKSYFLNK